MHFNDVKAHVTSILQAANGQFLTAYQICHIIEREDSTLWKILSAAYPTNTTISMGKGTGEYYSPASFIANALKWFVLEGSVPGLKQEILYCEGVVFSGIEPGFTGNVVGIWAIQ